MSLLKQQLLFILVAILSVLIFFLYQYDLQQFLKLHPVIQKQRLLRYAFAIILNYGLISAVYLFLRKTWLTIFLSQFVILLLSFINVQKEQYLAASLLPSDIFLLKETWIASPLLLKFGVVASLLIFLAAFIWFYRKQANEPMRLFYGNTVLALGILSFFVTANFKDNFTHYCRSTADSILCPYTAYLPNTRGDWVGDHLTIRNLGYSAFFFSKSVDSLNTKIFKTENIEQARIDALLSAHDTASEASSDETAETAQGVTQATSEVTTQAKTQATSQATSHEKTAERLTESILTDTATANDLRQNLNHSNANNTAPALSEADKQRPNIVFVMSESHWDARLLDKSIPKNITPTIDKHQLSTLLSPSFGGGTANVEFEVLTSLNVNLNHNELLYVSKLKRPTYSLARYFNQLGYDSTAMHNNGKYFYNRSAVYQNLGFKQFVSLDNMVTAAERKNYINQAGWANDDLIYQSIEQQLKHNTAPQFIYAISVENHPMYNDDRFGKAGYAITKPGLSDPVKRQMNTYLMGMKRADDKLKQLIQTAEKLERPTIIIFFGDHLPNLQNVYDEYGFFASAQDKAEKKDPRYFQTPLSVWSNAPFDRKALKSERIAAHFLAARIIQAANLPASPYYQLIGQINQCYPAIHQTLQQANPHCGTPDQAAKLLAAYKDLNADVINGKNWTYQYLKSAQDTEN